MLTLKTDRLRVEIAEPGETPNTTKRFDRSGFIAEVILDEQVRFCAAEPRNLSHPSSGGRGLCNEYSFNQASIDAPLGSRYPKPGIGLVLKKDAEPYIFYKDYNIEPFSVSIVQNESSIEFLTDPVPCMGYAVRQKKTVSAEENVLSVSVTLENAGERLFAAQEYCHNFLSIDGMAISPGYRLEIPALKDLGGKELAGTLKTCGRGFTFSNYSPEAMFHEIDMNSVESQGIFKWTLANAGAKASIRCCEDIKLHHLCLWACDHIISVESFHGISLKPGESSRWERKWIFERI
ncbi:MAG: hypothetical protein LBU32_24095 [Clostridiales bacterium]|nr:hypothetical protein [Clostridiales bacterium]